MEKNVSKLDVSNNENLNVVDKENQEDQKRGPNSTGSMFRMTWNKVMTLYLITGVLVGLGYIAYLNPHIFLIQGDTLQMWNQAINAVVLLIVPFIFGAVGAFSRVLLAGEQAGGYRKVILASGIFASFSWMGIKSKVFLALLSPYIEKANPAVNEVITQFPAKDSTEFYSMALVAVMVGMFSSNIFIFINQKVEQLTKT